MLHIISRFDFLNHDIWSSGYHLEPVRIGKVSTVVKTVPAFFTLPRIQMVPDPSLTRMGHEILGKSAHSMGHILGNIESPP